MGRNFLLADAVATPPTFLVTLLNAIKFSGNMLVPGSIDSGDQGAISAALASNTALLSIFVPGYGKER